MSKLFRPLPVLALVLGLAFVAHPRSASAQASKSYDFTKVADNACTVVEGKVTFNPDGTGFFEAQTSTASNNTYFKISVKAKSSGLTVLYQTPTWTGPRMSTGRVYPWTGSFVYDRSLFPAISTVSLIHACGA
jgi:hypothetical protein